MVCDFENDTSYEFPGTPSGERWLEEENGVLNVRCSTKGSGNSYTVSSIIPSLDMMIMINIPNTPLWEIPLDSEQTFGMAEFPEIRVTASGSGVVVGGVRFDVMRRVIIGQRTIAGDMRTESLWLSDINGDGKREICAAVTEKDGALGSGIVVYDIAGGKTYILKSDTETAYSLDGEDNVLYAVVKGKEISRVPLSLDMMTKPAAVDYEEVYLGADQTFMLPDFEGFEFEVDTRYKYPQFSFGWGSSSVSNHVTGVYLYDIDGDGKREIAMNCPYVGNGCIRVYGFMDNGEPGCAEYYEDNGCWLSRAEDDTLKYYTNNKIGTFKFSKSDLKPTFARNYSYQLLGWDHTLDFTEILPSLDEYEVTINNRTLKIKHGGEQIFDSGISLKDLYSIPNKENNSVVLIYITESVGGDGGMVGAVKLSEKSAERYDFEEGISIKPTTDEPLLVKADGSEEPFRFPKDSVSLLQ